MTDKSVKIPELLAPVGSSESLAAAVNGGCDAVYLGGKAFSARSGAENFTDDELERAIDYCHLRGVKAYVAVNTLVKQNETAALFAFLQKALNAGADALITQDLGQAALTRKYFPQARLHASTQTAASDAESARFLVEAAGFERVTVPRELSLADITEIVMSVPAEIEVFAHGALCVCFSGRCLMSAEFGGRSGNRGKCAQPCRHEYTLFKNDAHVRRGFLLSPKDMMTLDILPEIVKTGVACLKIEGRMKSPEYVGLATRLYREQLDKIKDGSPFVSTRDVESLAQTFGRGGSFTSGYFKKTGGADMMSIKTPKSTGAYAGSVVKISPEGRCVIKTERELIPGDGVEIAAKTSVGTFINRLCRPGEKFFVDLPKASDARVGDKVFRTYDKKLNDELKRFYSRDVKKTPVTCSVTALADRPLEITLKNDRVSVTVMGGLVSAAVNRPMGGEILERVGKIGNYPFKPAFKDCHTGDDVFISVGQINELKRTAADRFAQALLDSYKKTSVLDAVFDVSPRLPLARKSINVQIDSLNLFDGVLLDGVDVIYAEADDIIKRGGGELSAKARKNGSRLFAALPAFAESARTEELVRRLRADGIDGFLARTLGQLSTLKFLRKRLEGGSDLFEKQTAADYGLNIFNGHALAFILNFAHTACLSTELSFEDSALFANEYCEIIVHGRTPLMTTKQCPAGLYDGGKDGQYCAARYSGDSYTLLDRKGAVLPVKRDCDACVAYILNEKTLCALDRQRKPALSPAGAFRICLTTETEAQARDIVGAYVLAAERGFSDESPKTHFLEIYGDDATTGGRLFSGVY